MTRFPLHWLREPLVQFAALGALVFVVYALAKPASDLPPDRIIVTQAQISQLATGFTNTWRRPPKPEELDTLVADYIREEIYYREAIAMGLDRDDTVVRRRLRQKLEFVTRDVAPIAEPTDAQLQEYLTAHADSFASEQRLTFDHIYVDRHRRGDAALKDAAAIRAKVTSLRPASDLEQLGDPFVLELHFASIPPTEVTKLFGESFARQLSTIPLNEWAGPLESPYGLHLVRVTARTERAMPQVETVRNQVRNAWARDAQERVNEAFYERLRARYAVTVEGEKTAGGGNLAATTR